MNNKAEIQELGNKIKELRIKHELTQEQLASKLGVAGKSAIANYEKGYNKPEKNKIEKLADIFGVSIDYFRNWHDLLIEGNIEYANIYFEDKNLTVDDKIDELHNMMETQEKYVQSCQECIKSIKSNSVDSMIRNENIKRQEEEIKRTKAEIEGLKKILEKLKNS